MWDAVNEEAGVSTSSEARGVVNVNRNLTVREKLIAAARTVMGRDGVETSSIPTIVDEAGVGRGSFYNHFGSKEELARAVLEDQMRVLQLEIDAMAKLSDDVPRSASYGIRRCVEMAANDPVWGWFFVHASPVVGDFTRFLDDTAAQGHYRGMAQGSLKINDPEATMALLQAGVTTLLASLLKGTLNEARAYAAIENLLRLMGVDQDLAREITGEPTEVLRQKLGFAPAVSVAI